jgi:hypothetical protein
MTYGLRALLILDACPPRLYLGIINHMMCTATFDWYRILLKEGSPTFRVLSPYSSQYNLIFFTVTLGAGTYYHREKGARGP